MDEERGGVVIALARGLSILQCFTAERRELGPTDLAGLLNLPQPTVWRLCQTLKKLGFLVPGTTPDKLCIGEAVLRLGHVAAANTGVVEYAYPMMRELAQRFGGSVSLSSRFGADMLAVGTTYEAASIKDWFGGDLLVLTPFRRGEEPVPLPDRVIRSVSSVDGVHALVGARVVIECMSSMKRHGIREDELGQLHSAIEDVRLEGFALHLPLDRTDGTDAVEEVTRRDVKKAYVYANNHFSAKSVANAAILKHKLGQELPGEYPEEFVERYPDLDGLVKTIPIGPLLTPGSKPS